MRLPAVSVALLSLTLACADATPKRAKRHSTGHLLVPLRLSGGGNARSDDAAAGTGRDLMAKLMLFKNMFQPPPSNVIIVQPTTPTRPTIITSTFTSPTTISPTVPTVTLPSTITTTPLARANTKTDRRNDGGGDGGNVGDAAPTGPPDEDEADDTYGEMPPVVLGTNGATNKLGVGRRAIRRKNNNNNNNKKRLRGQQHLTSYNRPAVTKDSRKGSDDHDRGNRHATTGNGYRKRRVNRRKRKQKIKRIENGNRLANANEGAGSDSDSDSNNDSGGSGNGSGVGAFTMGPNVIGSGSTDNNDNNNNNNSKNPSNDNNSNNNKMNNNNSNNNNNNTSSGIFQLNARARIKSFMNAFRRQQTPTVHNH